MGEQPMRTIDLNSDLGESYGALRIGYDDELFPLISSANVACGFHGGEPRTLERTVAACRSHGVGIGAHPGFPDLVGFGRRVIAATPDEVRTDTLYQLGALDAFCRAAGVRMQHVKPHGALSNAAMKDEAIAGAIAAAIRAYDPTLLLFAMPGSALLAAGEVKGLRIAREAFADRAYNADGSLVNRRLPGAMITDPEEAARRMVRLAIEGVLTTIDGQDLALQADTICTHSDTPGAVEIVQAVRRGLEAAGIAIQAPEIS
jgi:5-oxoprolinase (ATP-hydrolysing) subunit A